LIFTLCQTAYLQGWLQNLTASNPKWRNKKGNAYPTLIVFPKEQAVEMNYLLDVGKPEKVSDALFDLITYGRTKTLTETKEK